MAKEHASRIWTFNLQVWSLPLSPLCYRNLAFKVFCLLILSLFPGCKGLGLAWITSAENQLFRLYKTFFFLNCSYDTQTIPALQGKQLFRLERNVFSALLLWNSDKPGFAKKEIRLLKNVFFHTALMKLRQSRLCKKNIFSGSKKMFFRMPLVKSANSTSLPRLSSLQIAQMHAIDN